VAVVPQVNRSSIGDALQRRIERIAGPSCSEANGIRAQRKLRARLGSGPLSILSSGPFTSLHLPGGRILLNRSLVEDFEEPDVIAGYIVAEMQRSREHDPLHAMLEVLGPWTGFRLMTSGEIDETAFDEYAAYLLGADPAPLDSDALLGAFAQVQVRSTPYAYARDVTGESTLALIEGDPMRGQDAPPLLSDADWLRLQGICGG
jgi:hypothetical protein